MSNKASWKPFWIAAAIMLLVDVLLFQRVAVIMLLDATFAGFVVQSIYMIFRRKS